MLTIVIPAQELWNESKSKFEQSKEYALQLEHSLISLSKWEAKYEQAFLGPENKTSEQTLDYIRFMTINKNVDAEAYNLLTTENLETIKNYIEAGMSATRFYDFEPIKPPKSELITAEIVYYWMVALNIPFECQKWHLNRLLTFIRVCNMKNNAANGKKTPRKDVLNKYRALNESRRAALGTKG